MKKIIIIISIFLSISIFSIDNIEFINKISKKIGTIEILEPEIYEHGLSKSLKDATISYGIKDVIKFNGHICPGSLSGFLLTKMVIKKLSGDKIFKRGDISITFSTPSGTSDIAIWILGVKDHFGISNDNLKFDKNIAEAGKIVLIFKNKKTKQTVKAVFNKGKLLKSLKKDLKVFKSIKSKIVRGKAKSSELKKFGELLQTLMNRVATDPENFITIK